MPSLLWIIALLAAGYLLLPRVVSIVSGFTGRGE